ncbi:SDR family NAD(P)-dependent oxidoreductase [Kutzneria kofuensis]|uniref:6-deoxyerythronolide-B synthase n=1 Tax=Kutzneria kofuensis TaxID=103725 RepID=A0A7W9NJW6_9PSEU|nr:type I polyketide synthase [Kutzneria kofuensis]MBB5895104.1 acyl transferase domain-containing protein/acyl carrier protein [Kutzneria kofuensis]
MSESGNFVPDAGEALARRLGEVPPAEQTRILLGLVSEHTLAVLQRIRPGREVRIGPDEAFRELGLDSLGLVELHTRLGDETGLALPPTIGFDYPTPNLLAAYLRAELLGLAAEAPEPVASAAADDEPIAIVGIGCRLPGGVDSPDALWQLVSEGRHVRDEFPTDRGWDLDRLYDPDPDNPGTTYVRHGGFLPDAAEFDADFFGISPREASAMDPQQRLVLETAWQALERAGIDPQSLRGSRSGVFVGAEPQEYGVRLHEAPDGFDGYLLTGNAPSVVSGRVAYTLGLEGPTLTVDTACSGSLVALHLAVQSLRLGECTLALAGGVAVMGSPGTFTAFARQRGLAPDGVVKAFAAAADGTGFAEGVGILVLERLSEARRNGHNVLAVIRGSAINQDGASNGITAPNGLAQQRVIRQALANAGLTAEQVDAVEAHGTGTTLGDPIEANALQAVYGKRRDRPMWLGSLKSNIGHTQAAAGVAGVIKMVTAMRHGVLPKTLHVDAPTPHVDWAGGAVTLLTEEVPWDSEVRRAGVSSFGVSGTNAHLILEQAPIGETEAGVIESAQPTPDSVSPFVVSARSAEALKAQAARLTSTVDLPLVDLANSLATTRAALEHRAVVIAGDRDELLRGLNAIADGSTASNVTGGRLAFLFTGQGSQRVGMGRELAGKFPVFAEALDEAIAHLDVQLDRPLNDVLFGAVPDQTGEELLGETAYTQAALFAVEVALFRLLESWGVTPDLVAGHSVGELAAAHIAGVLSLEDAATLVAARGRLMQDLPRVGAMVSVRASEVDVRAALEGYDGVSIAAVNGPNSVVLSGVEEQVLAVAGTFAKSKRLRTSHAFHSALMEPMLEEFRLIASVLDYNPPQIPVVSNVTGRVASAEDLCSPDYWVRHVREAVRFADGITTLVDEGVTTFIELGPDPVLSAMGKESVDGDVVFAAALRRDRDEVRELLTALGTAWSRGAKVDWSAFFAGAGTVELPTYAFQRRRYWMSSAIGSGDATGFGQVAADHPLLGAVVGLAGGDGVVLTGRVSLRSHPWLADHVMSGVVLFPGTAFVELAVRAGDQVGLDLVEELTLESPLALPESGGVALQIVVGAEDDGRRTVEFYSRADTDESWTRHATGVLGRRSASGPVSLDAWPPRGAEKIDISTLYADMAGQGYGYGPVFRGLRAVWRNGSEVFAEVALPEQEKAGAFALHPALLDAVLHATDFASDDPVGDDIRLPFAWSGVSVHSTGASALRVRITSTGREAVSLDIADSTGAPVATVESFVVRAVTADQLRAAGRGGEALFQVRWEAIAPVNPVPSTKGWAVVGADYIGLADALGSGITVHADLQAHRETLDYGALPSEVVLAPFACCSGDVPNAVRRTTYRALELVQEWLTDERFTTSRLVVVTQGAVVGSDDPSTLCCAPLWGLLRSAQAENPGRIVLVDVDEDSAELLPAALASGEPELALRGGEILVPRLAKTSVSSAEGPWTADGTVLITGGTGGLGGIVAKHLVADKGVRHLLLTSRRGTDAPGAAELSAELTALGASVTIAAVDVADRDALAAVIDGIPAEHPLTGVVHAAGVIDDGLIGTLTSQRIDTTLRPKAEAAWHLHELTKALDLKAFVLFSSSAGLVDGAGQGNYAAANVFLDALARHRQALGLPATALAWGLWAVGAGMGEQLDELAIQRIRRLGLDPLNAEESLALFDAAVAGDLANAVPVRVDARALQSRSDGVPALFRGLVRPQRPTAAGPVSVEQTLAHRLAELSDVERDRVLLDLVRKQVADVLGHDGAEAIDPKRAFTELGFDSLAAVELRNRLNSAFGLRLPATLTFDYPTSAALAKLIGDKILSVADKVVVKAPVVAATDEPIAIVGIACRYPGGVSSPEDLWQVVAEGRDVVTTFPTDRGWDVDGLYDPEPGKPGKSYSREGGFLHEAAEFDPAFFGISPREASAMDPQQRLLLETAWETFERAGIDPISLRGSDTGVFAGVMYHDWGTRLGEVSEDVAGYLGNGSLASVVSGRIAYALGLEGPAVTVDTACSSSLVALHWAIQALRAGECSLALAGGVTVMSTPDTFVDFSRQRGMAADGRCKSFATAADGTGWSEGVGLLLVERFSDAVRNGHDVLAVVRGSAINQDGASNGLTAPNGPSQQRVIHQALASGGLTTSDVDVVEGHGTGTTLGDPIEAQALLATYGQDRSEPLWLGSIKSNMGHTQAAAGVAGIIKMVMAMRHGVLPKTLHVDEPSSKVDWAEGAVRLLTDAQPWPAVDRPRRAGVSSFGISGTNAHVIIEQAPVVAEPERTIEPRIVPWLVSGKTAEAAAAQAARLSDVDGEPLDIAFSLATTRAALEHRIATVSADRSSALADLAAGKITDVANDGFTAFLFTGQGAQQLGMGRELHERFPAFAAAWDAAIDPAIAEIAWGDDQEALNQTGVTQPALFAFEVALYRLLESWGVTPNFVAGHSIGEIAAAHVAGVLSLEDARKLVSARGRLMQALPTGGAMVALQATEDEITLVDGVGIAAVNGPQSVVISGVEAAVLKIKAEFEAKGRKTSRLNVSHAFHSPLMEPMLDEFRAVVAGLTFNAPRIPNAGSDWTSPEYWVNHVRDAVRFYDGVKALAAQGVTRFIEIGPDAVLTGMAATCVDDAATIATQRRGRTQENELVTALARAWANGLAVDWPKFFAGTNARRTDLPTYAFQHQRYWLNATATSGDVSSVGQVAAGHPMLGAVIALADGDGVVITGRLAAESLGWLADHQVLGSILLPGTGFVELAAQAGQHVGCESVEELTLQAPLILPPRGGYAIQVTIGGPDATGARPVSIHSRPEGSDTAWTRHAMGTVAPAKAPAFDLTEWPPAGATPIDVTDAYGRLTDRGYGYGPTFQGLTAAWKRGDEVFAEVSLPEGSEGERYGLHPALLDSAMHADLLDDTGEGATLLPFSWNGVTLHAVGATALRVRIQRLRGDEVSAMWMADQTGQPVLTVESLVSRAVSAEQLSAAKGSDGLHRIEWKPTTAQPSDIDVVHYVSPTADGEVPKAVRKVTGLVLNDVQSLLADGTQGVTAIITSGAVSVGGEDIADLSQAAVWGLVRAAQAEQPGRLVLVDTDNTEASAQALSVAASLGEPEVAIRDGEILVPRLSAAQPTGTSTWDTEGTVLITGGTSGLGAIIARHLATQGVTKLALVSRRGAKAPEAAALTEELTALGAEVTVFACDVTKRVDLAKVIRKIPDLTGVVHAAAVVDNGLIDALTAEQVDKVLRPKVDAAWHLHELTKDLPLTQFVLFSSAGGIVLAAGQANYAAANVFLDALAQHRRANGLPANALAFGMWAVNTGLGGELVDADLDRMRRLGMPALPAEEALELFDQALAADEAVIVPLKIDREALRTRTEEIPALLRGFVRVQARRAAQGQATVQTQFAGLSGADLDRALLELVRGKVAAVLGHDGIDAVPADKAFKELGFDSLAAVELRNMLNTATGLKLPATLVFDYPNSRRVAEFVATLVGGAAEPAKKAAPTQVRADDPIAVVGISCRFPGGVTSPEDLWKLVFEGRDAVTPFPTDRGWAIDSLFDPEPGKPGHTYARDGAFLLDAADFDAEFFGIMPREALAMDPQQRLLLQASWEAFERAGIDPTSMRGSQTGVYAGVMYHDYGTWLREIPDDLAGYIGNGNAGSIASGRVAYTLGLEGPAVTVDTACSSSLVAVHTACQALRSGEISMALAGGVTVMSTPEIFVEFSQQRGLAPDGRCKAFAGAADGTGWSEGIGMLLLERLSDAKRNGHEVLAVIRGSAINQDGASNGLTAPNGPSQQRVIQRALAVSGLTGADVDLIEGHGTGTRLGDPIEAQALLATYGQERTEDDPVWLGSIKSNLGHAQAAAGVSGLIKVIMAVRNGVMPKTLHVDEPSPQVDWTAGAVKLLTEAREWKTSGPRRGAVSSFGLSGTNAHVIVEQAPESTVVAATGHTTPVIPLVLSAKTAASLPDQAEKLRGFLATGVDLFDTGFSLATTRAQLEHRALVLANDRESALSALTALANGEESPNVVRGAKTDGQTAFLFTGQGSQRIGMGRELYEAYPAFAQAWDEVVARLDPELSTIVWGSDPEALNQTGYAQPALFALEVALYRLVQSWGVRPDFLAGHSIGELAAAHVSGVLSLEDACKLVSARGRLMQALPAGGAMVAIQATEEEITLRDGVGIAAVNGPTSVVISGDEEAVLAIRAEFEALGRKTTRLKVSHAFHSPLMEPMLDEFRKVAESLTYGTPTIPVVTTSAGGGQWSEPEYWVDHVREAVRFCDAVRSLEAQGVTKYLEIGPDGVLTGMAQGCLTRDDDVFGAGKAVLLASLRKDRPEAHTLLAAVGLDLDGKAFFAGGRRVDLPTYAFQKRRYWLDMQAASVEDAAGLGQVAAQHPLLAAVVQSPETGGVTLTTRLSIDTHPWLADHDVLGTVILPGTAYVELAVRAGEEVGCDTVEELTIEALMPLPPRGEGLAVQTVVGPEDKHGARTLAIYSRPENAETGWTRHASGVLTAENKPAPTPEAFNVGLREWPPAGAEAVDISGVYDYLAGQGYIYGPMFRGLRGIWLRGEETFVEVALPEEAKADAAEFFLHPGILDSALSATDFMAGRKPQDVGGTQLPFAWTGVTIHSVGANRLRGRVVYTGGSDAVRLELADPMGTPVATIRSLVVRPVTADKVNAAASAGSGLLDSVYRIAWNQMPLGSLHTAARGDWATVSGAADVQALTTVPEVALLPVVTTGDGVTEQVREVVDGVLATLRAWLADARFSDSKLLVITRNAVTTADGEDVDVAQAPIWGLLRSAQEENPGRFVLVDSDGSEDLLPAVIASGEPAVALRGSGVKVPRFARVSPSPAGTPRLDPDGTVLITGGTSGLGAVFARHLVSSQGIKHLLLTSRRGIEAPGAADLQAELTALGADVKIAACDVSDRDALAKLLSTVEHPLTGVLHAAGVMDNAMITGLTPEQIDNVLRPKVDAAWHLHELTRDLPLAQFVLFSSCAGLIIGAGQGNYAAANRFVDGLAAHRRAAGLPATSLGFGPWATDTGMSGGAADSDVGRMARLGIQVMSTENGLRLFDEAMTVDEPILAPIVLAAAESGSEIPLLLKDVLKAPARKPARAVAADAPAEPEEGPSLERRLAGLSESERDRVLLDLVRTHVAVVRHDDPYAIDVTKGFTELGLDSLAAIELRNRLQAATDLRLPATLMFDYPNPVSLARFLLEELLPAIGEAPAEQERSDDEIQRAVAAIPVAKLREAGILAQLLELAGSVQVEATDDQSEAIKNMDIDDLVAAALAADN